MRWEHLHHMATVIMTRIHNVFPPDNTTKEDPISLKIAEE